VQHQIRNPRTFFRIGLARKFAACELSPMNLADVQKRSGLTATELARRLEVSDGHMADLKSGRRSLTLALAAKLEQVTGVSGIVDAVVAEKTGRPEATHVEAA
jgi:transcriptional regulator with XRE-family HTH domain